MTNHQGEVDQLLADYRRSRDQVDAARHALDSISASASDRNGLVTATVNAQGHLIQLDINENAYRRYSPTELANTVLNTVNEATEHAAEQTRATLAPVIPAGMNVTVLASQPTKSPKLPHDDETSFAEQSWLDTPNGGAA